MNLTLGLLLAPLVGGLLVTAWMARRGPDARLVAAALVLPALALRHLLEPPPPSGNPLTLIGDGRGEWLLAAFAVNLLAAFAVIALAHSLRERDQAERLQWDSMESLRALVTFFGGARGSFDDRLRELLELGCRALELDVGLLLRLDGTQPEIVASSSAPGSPLSRGQKIALSKSAEEAILSAPAPLPMEDRTLSLGAAAPGSVALGSTREGVELRTSLSLRVELADEIFGALCFGSTRPRGRRFTAVDKQLLSLMAHGVAQELLHHQVDHDQNENARRQATTLEISRHAALEPAADTLGEGVRAIARTLSVPRVAVLEHNPADGRFRVVAEIGCTEEACEALIAETHGGLLEALGSTELAIFDDLRDVTTEASAAPLPAPLRAHGIASAVCIPIQGVERPFGVLWVCDIDPRVFSDEERAFLRLTANLLTASMRIGSAPPATTRDGPKRLVARRSDDVDRRRLDVAASIHHLEPELQRALGDRKLRLQLDAAGPQARVYRYEFDRVVWSLLSHVAELASPGSVLTITSASVDTGEAAHVEPFIALGVQGEVPSLDAEALAALIDDPRPGSGGLADELPARRLGLPRIERLLRDAGGDLSVETEHGRGVSLTAYLPVASAVADDEPTERPPS